MPAQYLLLKDLISGRPALGDGFDPLIRYVSPRKASAVSFTATTEEASTQYADISEVGSIRSQTSAITLSASGKYSTYVSGRFSTTDEATFFSQNTVFSVMVVALVRRVVATSIALSPGLERIGADAFRATHGTQIVKIMHYGGYISLLFRFARLDTTTTAKVKAALDFWYGTGSVSLDSAMSSHDVWMEYEIRSDQEGGNVPLFLGTSLESLRTHLAAWHPTLADHAQPILMEVVDYKTAVPGFPYRFRSWIETPANADVSANLIGERRSAAGRGSPAPRVRAARRSERYQVYAAPAPFWGPWSVVGSHIGRATFQIAVEPIGSTVVRGEVKYYDANNTLVEQPFHDQVTIRTGDSVANVEVRLQGVPSGSSCWVTVS